MLVKICVKSKFLSRKPVTDNTSFEKIQEVQRNWESQCNSQRKMEKSQISKSFSGGDIELRDHFALELMEGAVLSSLKWLFLSFMIQLCNSFKPHRLGKCIFINTNGYIAVSLSTLMCLLPLTPIYQLSHYCFEQRYHFGKKY